MFRCNLPPAILTECPGSLTCQCGNTRVERTPNKSQHTKLTLEKKILPPLLPVFELATFRSRVRRSNRQATPAPTVESGIYAKNKTQKKCRWESPWNQLIMKEVRCGIEKTLVLLSTTRAIPKVPCVVSEGKARDR